LRFFSFGGYGLALAALALVVFGAYDRYPNSFTHRPTLDFVRCYLGQEKVHHVADVLGVEDLNKA